MNKLLILMLLFLFLSLTVMAWTPWVFAPNYNYNSNVSVRSFNGVLFNNPLNRTGWFLFSTGYNAILNSTPVGQLTIWAYDANDNWIGYVNAFQYPVGGNILIANSTTAGIPYNAISIFFGERTVNLTYLSNFNNNNINSFGLDQRGVIAPTRVTEFNTSGVSGFVPVINYSKVGQGNFSGTFRMFFNLSSGYFFYGNNNKDRNVTLNYVISELRHFRYSANQIMDNLSDQGFGFFGLINAWSTVLQSNTNTVFIYANPDTTIHLNNFLTENSGLFNQGGVLANSYGIFNSFVEKGVQIGQFDYPTYAGHTYQYELDVNFTNTIRSTTDYWFVPAYSSNYIVTDTNTISNPTNLPSPASCAPSGNGHIPADNQTNGWYYYFKYRENESINDWQYRFTGLNGLVTTNNVGFILLNTTHRQAMDDYGQACGDVYFRGFSGYPSATNDLGSVPFTLQRCTPTLASFILPNTTSNNFIYTRIYMYYGSSYPSYSFSNPAVGAAWQQVYSSGTNITISPLNRIVKFNGALAWGNTVLPSSIQNTQWTAFNGFGRFGIMGSPQGNTNAILQAASFAFLQTGTETTAWIVYRSGNTSMYTATLNAFHRSNQIYTIENSVTISSQNTGACGAPCGFPEPTRLNLAMPNTAVVQQFYTTDYNSTTTEAYSGTCSSSGTPSGQPVSVPNTNMTFVTNSMAASIPTNIVLMNATLTTMGLTKNLNLGSLIVPAYVIYILELIIFLIVVSMTDDIHESLPLLFGTIFIWITGILYIQVLILGAFITIMYGAYIFIEKHKK